MKKFEKDSKEDKIGELCKQVENRDLMMTKQPRKASKKAGRVCYNCSKKGCHALQIRMELEPTGYKCYRKVTELLCVAQK